MSLASQFLSQFSFQKPSSDSPLVTLTFAQSLDGKIAGKQGHQLILSGPESMEATHILRSLHDGILVGIGTLLNDDPRLTVRLNPDPLGRSTINHPQPIILDSKLLFPENAKLLLPNSPKKPFILTSPGQDPKKRQKLEDLGARVFEVEVGSDGHISIPLVLELLSKKLEVKSLMVEGGARIISAFLKSKQVDLLLVTIAPVFVGQDGISTVQSPESVPKLKDIVYQPLGRDIMMGARLE